MINSILATDMGLHFKYMTDLGQLQEKLEHDKGSIDSWNSKVREERKELTCGLLIKCADISNVVSFCASRNHLTCLTPLLGANVRSGCKVGKHPDGRIQQPGRHGARAANTIMPLRRPTGA